jgi:ElaA protein
MSDPKAQQSAPEIVQKSWSELTIDELYSILKLRTDVFFVEQRIDETELDGRDREPETIHLWIPAPRGGVAAYLRILTNPEPEYLDANTVIGRVVVAPGHRGSGLAKTLMQRVIDDFGHRGLLLHSQSYIAPLYAGFGFEPYGDEYPEAGILHRSMYRAGR